MKIALFILIVVFVLTVLAFSIAIDRQLQKMHRKNRVLSREIAEHVAASDKYLRLKGRTDLSVAPKDKESIPRLKNMSDAELFEFLRVVIVSEGLFLAPAFGCQNLVARFRLKEEDIASAFARGSKYGTLQAFINECRLKESVKMLKEHPEISIQEVARQSGYANVATFAAVFEERYTFTPEEFRRKARE